MKFVFLCMGLVLSNLFGSFNLDSQFANLNSSSIKSEALKQTYLSEPLERLIDADDYTLGPGDGVYLNIVTANQIVNLNLFVSPIGDVLIPVVGTVGVDGLTINNGFERIKSKCLEKYNDSNISITLSKVREFKIKVLGPFQESGIYVSTPINRVSDIYNQIMTNNRESTLIDTSIVNIKDLLSKRNIILTRDGKDYRVDLIKFNLLGEDALNPFLRTGDIIYFDLSDNQITVTGGVKSPGIYEFVNGETLTDFIKLTGGFSYNADYDKVELIRYISDFDASSLIIHESEFDNTVLFAQDLINVRVKNNYKEHKLVEITGQVVNPGFYAITEGATTVKDIIEKSGGYTSLADKHKISIINIDDIGKNKEVNNKVNYFNREEFHDYVDKSYKINELSQLRPINSSTKEYTQEMLNYNIYGGDIIDIPKQYPYVQIIGAVKYPGLYSYSSKKTIKQYLNDAGGITEAETQDIFIIKPYSGQRINYNDIKKIESGDIIYIVEKIKYDKRTKLQDVVMITNGITSTLSFILTLMVVMGGVN